MIQELKSKESITIESINIDYCNSIAMSEFQLKSYEKLFQSCLSSNIEITNEFNMNKFLNEYSNRCAEIELYKLEILKDTLKDEYNILMNGSFKYFIDYNKKVLTIIKI